MKKTKAIKGYFVTSSSFNRFALEYADGMDDIELIDGKQLLKMINGDDRFPLQSKMDGFFFLVDVKLLSFSVEEAEQNVGRETDQPLWIA